MPQLPISDEYFNRSAAVVAGTPVHNTRVRYCVFAHESGVICGINRAVAFLKEHCIGPLSVRALRDGDRFGPVEAVMVVEGLFGELVILETTYLGMLAFSGPATHMDEIVRAAAGVPVIDMAARHYPYEIIQQTAYAAAVGGAAVIGTVAALLGAVAASNGSGEPLGGAMRLLAPAPGWIPLGVLAGTAGMFADSLLGATLEDRIGLIGNDGVNLGCTLVGAGAAWLLAGGG